MSQSLKHCESNHPDLLRLYLDFDGPPTIHESYKYNALYTVYGGRSSPFPVQANIMEVDANLYVFTPFYGIKF